MSNNRIAGWAIVGRGDDRRRIKQGTARYSGHEWYFHDLKGEHFSWCYPWRPGRGDETELDWFYSSQAAALTALLELLTAEIHTLQDQRQAVGAELAVLRGAPRQEGLF